MKAFLTVIFILVLAINAICMLAMAIHSIFFTNDGDDPMLPN